MSGDLSILLNLSASFMLLLGIAYVLRPKIEVLVQGFGDVGVHDGGTRGLVELLSHVTGLTIILSLNQFFGLNAIVPTLVVVMLIGAYSVVDRTRHRFLGYSAAALAIAAILAIALNVHGLWLTEGVNHDVILYVRGGDWALENGTLAADALVSRELIFGRETAACVLWIGDACRLHRGGTHTLAALTGLFRGDVIPTASFFAPVFLSAGLYAALSLNRDEERPNQAIGLPLLLTVLLAASAPILTSLANGNTATAVGAIVIMCSALVFVSPAARANARVAAITLGALAGAGAHLYSESMWIAAAIAALHVAFSSSAGSIFARLKTFARLSGFALAAWLIAGNFAILMALRAVLTVSSEVAREMYWANYYLDVEPWRWLSMPFAGWLEGTNQLYPSLLGAAGTLAITAGCALSANRLRLLSCIVLTAFAVIMIELTMYFYGAHKVVELFGGVVLAAGAACYLQRGSHSRLSPVSVALTAVSVAVIALQVHAIMSFSNRARTTLLGPYAPKSISHAEAALFQRLNKDDSVLMNDLPWPGTNRFSKTNWTAFLGEREGAKVVMGQFGGELYRGGYGAADLQGTLRWPDELDWVVQASDRPEQRTFVRYEGAPVTSVEKFELVDLRDAPLAAVFMSHGFYEREPDRIWSSGAFVLEAVAPRRTDSLEPTIDVQLEYFAPPADGKVTILRNSEPILELLPTSGIVTVPLTEGYQSLEFRPSWTPVSPADIGLSADGRKLFASVFSITSRITRRPANPSGTQPTDEEGILESR